MPSDLPSAVAPPLVLTTPRLELIASTPEMAQAAVTNRQRLARLLQVRVPTGWPHPLVGPALPFFAQTTVQTPAVVGWWNWHWVLRDEGGERVLAGDGGFKGPPRQGDVELAYALVTEFHGRGLATEGCRALCDWARSQPDVTRLWAEAGTTHAASLRVLAKLGFAQESVDDSGQWGIYVYRAT